MAREKFHSGFTGVKRKKIPDRFTIKGARWVNGRREKGLYHNMMCEAEFYTVGETFAKCHDG